ncbi:MULTISPECIES: precorrin-6y C5,15-methyltransferase (decarboxylating) subunit CbiE [unclassified Azospirillum]|uniref:precorrin-6y C5,15-methyltransferase (decarboxylating) subunit CbiE n=1 Tax=unclassified Azospirillum TaxID=2630922 RepID=UPI000B71A2C4|nr:MULTISPECIES: precorrin-6y C5,15-methyltransferase (decarboxylating) subunit CbiE [unclassified Azospirillum]SNS16525.1 precorrin-6Y C5,15-methyltransferase (decarboxylating) [Azospirillum sp. RU38E]SNS33818.1 precorrin-6Y C5,15-methyltransferase (decarboxylating) [Azospirillum sp. RU37A]
MTDPAMENPADHAAPSPWLSIIGIGEDGLDGLGTAAREALVAAELVFGGKRHLSLAASLIQGQAQPWPSPFADGISAVLAARGRAVVVLASGDPFLHGVGATLAPHLSAGEWIAYPAPSAPALAASRLGWSLADVEIVSLHGRDITRLRPHLHPGQRLLLLTSDAVAPATIAQMLVADGFGPSHLTLFNRLGGPAESRADGSAQDFTGISADPLNLLAVTVAAEPAANLPRLTPGLPDDWFQHDGQITKAPVRALTLAALSPRRGELLWDLGAGSGSIAIEWCLRHPAQRAIAVERQPDRAARIAENARRLGVPDLTIINADSTDAIATLPTPDAIFIGGGAKAALLATCREALNPGGRLVVNAVTLETEALLLAEHASKGGSLLRLDIAQAAPVGPLTGWRPAMPIVQWRWEKPW